MESGGKVQLGLFCLSINAIKATATGVDGYFSVSTTCTRLNKLLELDEHYLSLDSRRLIPIKDLRISEIKSGTLRISDSVNVRYVHQPESKAPLIFDIVLGYKQISIFITGAYKSFDIVESAEDAYEAIQEYINLDHTHVHTYNKNGINMLLPNKSIIDKDPYIAVNIPKIKLKFYLYFKSCGIKVDMQITKRFEQISRSLRTIKITSYYERNGELVEEHKMPNIEDDDLVSAEICFNDVGIYYIKCNEDGIDEALCVINLYINADENVKQYLVPVFTNIYEVD